MNTAEAYDGPRVLPEVPSTKINHRSTGSVPVATSSVLTDGEQEPAVYLLGAHGGAGTTTLAHSMAPMRETDVFPAEDDPNMVAVVTALHRPGLDAAHRIIRQLQAGRAGGCALVGLIVVNTTGGKTPKPVAQRLAGVADNVSEVWEIPYIEAWRTVATDALPVWTPDPGETPRKKRKVDPLTDVPPSVADVALNICRSAVDLYESLS